MTAAPKLLFSEDEIAARVAALAKQIARTNPKLEIAAPILVGGFVFAADLLRALAREGLALPVEFLRLKSYAGQSAAPTVTVLLAPGEAVRGKHVLLIDGVLDRGHTIATANALLREAGAAAITTVVAVDKTRPDAAVRADFAAFSDVREFVVGYGMDEAGQHRALPYIGAL